MARIFVSYSRADEQVTRQFIELLRRVYRHPHTVFFDHEIEGGVAWWPKILDEISKADCFVYLISDESLSSPACQNELTEAIHLNKSVIPVIIRKPSWTTTPHDIRKFIERHQWIDLSMAIVRLKEAESIADLFAAINKDLFEITSISPESDVETIPTIPPDVKIPDLSEKQFVRRPILYSSLLVVGLAILAGLSIIIFPSSWADDSGNDELIPSITSPFPGNLSTNTSLPNMSPSLSTPTLMVDLGLATIPVTRNSEWQPYIRTFNGVEMVLVPTGCFIMGSIDSNTIEQPTSEQCFGEPFWFDRYEVTNEQFLRFDGHAGNRSQWETGNHPREIVNWFEALDFCEKRGGRLPTEVEWEYAARGPEGWIFPWGNSFDGNNAVWNSGSTSEVGSKLNGSSWVGAFDLAGNVKEWVSSLHFSYPYNFQDGREDMANTISERVLRGGGWGSNSSDVLRTFYREYLDPSRGSRLVGFRCARDFSPEDLEQP